MFSAFHKYPALLRQYGSRRCLSRLAYDMKRKHGLLKRRFPAWRWEDRPLSSWLRPGVPAAAEAYRTYRETNGTRFFFSPTDLPQPPPDWAQSAVDQAQSLRNGTFRYFSSRDGRLGSPDIDWFLNPFTGQRDSARRHWCDHTDFDPARGDVKYIWEPSRFAWAYTLARAYTLTRSDDCAETFWLLLESWMAANPPQMGPNWMCGQEIAIRSAACTFALNTFWNSPATTPERTAALVVLLAASAERIAANISHAHSQMSNHGVGEAAGLWTIGVLFPELKGASHWRNLARGVLEDDARDYVFPDGSYIQHSMNYQRFMLQHYLWCLRLAELNNLTLSPLTTDRIARSNRFLYQLQDAHTGRLPNYGANDGSLLFPLNSCDYLDYRPAIGALHYLLTRRRLYDDGPWSEDLLWLFGPQSLAAPLDSATRTGRDFTDGGYFTLRHQHSWAMVRCHSYRHRPSQADLLHFDLWWRGINLLRDSGSFTYYDPQNTWDRYFVSTAAHNTVAVGNCDQMIKGPRFQWHSLAQSRVLGRHTRGNLELWQGEHYGYRRLASHAVHRRAVCRLGNSYWLIIDDVFGRGLETATLHWHLPDYEYRIDGQSTFLNTPSGPCCIHMYCLAREWSHTTNRASDDAGAPSGWDSPHYGQRTPALTITARTHTLLPTRFLTLLALGTTCTVLHVDPACLLHWHEQGGQHSATATLATPSPDCPPVLSLEYNGTSLCPSPHSPSNACAAPSAEQPTVMSQRGE